MELNIGLIKSVVTIYDEMLTNGISLVYLGEFNHDITKMFTTMAEEDMEKNDEALRTKKKVYHVMVETLQNMNKHSDEISSEGSIGKGLFMIGKREDCYFIITSNKVAKDKKPALEEALRQINNASPEELKDMYKQQIKNGKISEKGGAGLGLIDIARKTTGKHTYHFLPYNDEYSFFILKVEIQGSKLGHIDIRDTPKGEAPEIVIKENHTKKKKTK